MATATASFSMVNHNHVESVTANEWEDEASSSNQPAPLPITDQPPQGPMSLKGVRAALRSSINALRPRSASSCGAKPSLPGRRDSASTGLMGSLLHGLANAVGLHRSDSPSRDTSPGPETGFSLGRRAGGGGQPHSLARLSSAALMRSELQNLSHFADLRNDSFTSRSCSKLRRRSSLLLPLPSDGSSTALFAASPCGTSVRTAGLGELSRCSAPAPALGAATSHLTCPGELPSPGSSPTAALPYAAAVAAAATTVARATQPQLEPTKSTASPFLPPSALAPGDVNVGGGGGGGLRARRSSAGAAALQGPLMVEIPPLPAAALSPRPPPQSRPSGSSLSPPASRSVSSDHLPPMTPGGGGGGLLSVRDRPPTPRAGRASYGGGGGDGGGGSSPSTLAKVLGSLHLPEILGSGRSVTEGRVSIAGVVGRGASFTRQPDYGMPRSRRNSTSSGPSLAGPVGAGPSITGPGGAAISASIAKRAAAAAGAGGGGGPSIPSTGPPVAAGGGNGLLSPVAPSGASWTASPRHSAPSGTGRTASMSCIKPACPQSGGGSILQDFLNSLELDDDNKPLSVADSEFDRRAGQPPPPPAAEAPGAANDGGATCVAAVSAAPRLSPSSQQHPYHHLQPLNYPNQPQLPQPPSPTPQLTPRQPQPPPSPSQPQVPRAPVSERTTPQNFARRSQVGGEVSKRRIGAVDGVGSGGGVNTSVSGGGGGGLPLCQAPRRQSYCCPVVPFDGGDDGCADQVLLTSGDDLSPSPLLPYECSSNKVRLASIRLSYVEGIIGGAHCGGGSGAATRESMGLPVAAQTRGSAAAAAFCAPPSPTGLAAPPVGRHPAAFGMVATAAAGGSAP